MINIIIFGSYDNLEIQSYHTNTENDHTSNQDPNHLEMDIYA